MKNHLMAFLVCCFVAWGAVANLLDSTTLPNGADIPFHYWRTFALGHSWSQGDVFARWSSLYNLGYGGVAFQFTAPAFYALANIIGFFTGVGIPLQMKWAWYLSVVLGCWGAWRFTFQRWGTLPAYYAMVAWATAPILTKYEPLVRGSFGVVLGLGCLMLALSYIEDIVQGHGGFLGLVGSVAGLMLAHNLTAVLGCMILTTWLGWHTVMLRGVNVRRASLAFVCGVMLAMWFWLPVFFELEWVSMHRLKNDPALDYRLFFAQLPQLFLPPQFYDPTLVNNNYNVHLGMLHGVGAVLGGGMWLWKGRSQSPEALYWLGCVGVGIVLATPLSLPIWNASEFLQTFQFPPRFLVWSMVGVMMLGSYGIFELLRVSPMLGQGVGSVALVGLLWFGQVEGQWGEVTFDPYPTAQDYLQMELEQGWHGTTASGEFLPNTVLEIPPPTAFVLDTLSANQLAQRYNPYAYPNAQFEVMLDQPNHYVLKITTPNPFTLELLQLGQMGWQTLVDGEPLAVSHAVPFGFPLIPIESGEHTLERVYPVSDWQWVGRGMALLGGMLALWVAWRSPALSMAPSPVDTSFHTHNIWYVGLLLITVTALKGIPLPAHHPPSSLPFASFENDVNLQAYQIIEVSPRQVWRVELVWASSTVPTTFNAFVHLLDSNGQDVLQHDKLDVRLDPHHRLRDVYYLVADAPLPRADYRVRVGMWRCLEEQNRYTCVNRQPIPSTVTGQLSNSAGWLILQP